MAARSPKTTSSRTKKSVRSTAKRANKNTTLRSTVSSKQESPILQSNVGVQTLVPKRWFYLLASVISFSLIFVLLKFIPANRVEISTSFLARDALLSRAGEQFLSVGSSALWLLDIRWIIVGGLVISGALCLFWLRGKHAEALGTGVGTLHGSYIGVTLASALLPIAMASGIRDTGMLLFILGSIVIASGIGSYLEKVHGSGLQISKHLYLLMALAMVLPIAAIKISLLGTTVLGLAHLTWQVYVSYALVALIVVGLLANALAHFKKWGLFELSGFTEKALVVLCLALQAAAISIVRYL